MPSTLRVVVSKTILKKPCFVRVNCARVTFGSGCFTTSTSWPASRASCSVRPTEPSSGIGEDRRRHDGVIGVPRPAAEHVLHRDARLVLRGGRELRAGRDVAGGPDPLDVRALPVVDDDVAAIALDARARRGSAPRCSATRPAASSTCDTRTIAIAGSVDDRYVAVARERLDADVENDVDPLVLERGLELVRRFGVGACRDLRPVVDDRHARAEAREDLRELEPDRPGADDEQRLRDLLELERTDVVDPVDVLDARERAVPPCASRSRSGCDRPRARARRPAPCARRRTSPRPERARSRPATAPRPSSPGCGEASPSMRAHARGGREPGRTPRPSTR